VGKEPEQGNERKGENGNRDLPGNSDDVNENWIEFPRRDGSGSQKYQAC
jgi:hypothetical protein